jgi:hypothetical protein
MGIILFFIPPSKKTPGSLDKLGMVSEVEPLPGDEGEKTVSARCHWMASPLHSIGRDKGQSVTEIAILIIIIVAALVAMQVYLKRGIQGRLRSNIDNIGEQYDPQATTSDFTVNHVSMTTTTTNTATQQMPVTAWSGGYSNTVLTNVTVTDSRVETNYDNTYRNGYEVVGNP